MSRKTSEIAEAAGFAFTSIRERQASAQADPRLGARWSMAIR
jgi:hypothetical protein